MALIRNVGGADRVVRIILGIALVALGLLGVLEGGWAIAGYIVAAIALVTAFTRYCPANQALGVNTARPKG